MSLKANKSVLVVVLVVAGVVIACLLTNSQRYRRLYLVQSVDEDQSSSICISPVYDDGNAITVLPTFHRALGETGYFRDEDTLIEPLWIGDRRTLTFIQPQYSAKRYGFILRRCSNSSSDVFYDDVRIHWISYSQMAVALEMEELLLPQFVKLKQFNIGEVSATIN